MQKSIIKRDGSRVPFDKGRITNAVSKAFRETGEVKERIVDRQAEVIANLVVIDLVPVDEPNVEQVQDLVEEKLMKLGFTRTARAYILYRAKHKEERTRKEEIMDVISGKFMEVTTKGKESSVTKGSSGNANVDTEGPMGKMLSYGAETSKVLALEEIVSASFAQAHSNGDIHIHDLDFYSTKTLTCCQIDLDKLFKGGFSTGHGFLREPNSIGSYAALAAIALQSNQNEQHGGQSIPMFDYYMAPGVLKTFKKEFKRMLLFGMEDLDGVDPEFDGVIEFVNSIVEDITTISFDIADTDIPKRVYEKDGASELDAVTVMIEKAYERALKATDKATYQAMEGFIHNLNTMHSRAGGFRPLA